ncbi:glucan biosynthesis protein G [Tatumella sp. OPLPL6]|uniref:glucan biosynthesis protein G n=1 Tax=Tatumella sp. OPLPL6 TaxID=1928657 RepID=UPI000C177ECA|nr:glucan biosynthesis protein G [Tatumella sp. OPLPL6]PIJ44883.1 glucan biosynthesis protein G [Tatumella sp. OPLPL6]
MLIKKDTTYKGRQLKWVGAAVLVALYTSNSWAFSIDDVAKQAKSLAKKSYQAPNSNLPSQLRELKYADYQQIQFKRDKAYWSKLHTPFKLEFYHEGMYFDQAVKINEVTASTVHEIKYDPAYFDFGKVPHDADTLKNLGFAGFKVLYPLNNRKKEDEISSFLGASYFRVVGAGQTYGLSARGLAIDTAVPAGEEFPRFKEFWIERPTANAKQLTIYALLDSPRATGAYRFIIHPGKESTVDVQSRVYLRDTVTKLGIAPLTSMYLFGANQPSPVVNYRNELHDSDGLSIHNGNGEWIWRPINNPRRLGVSTYQVENLKGFGLLQRNRDFSHYQDLDDRYDQRPSGWVEPIGQWGKGHIELVEIPTNDETNDNIVAFWSPEKLPEAGKEMKFDYRLHFTRDESALHDNNVAWVQDTLRSTGDVKQSNLVRQPDGSIAFLVDFVGKNLSKMSSDAKIAPEVSIGKNGEIVEQNVRYNPVTKGWRLTLRLRVKDPKQVTEMRAALTSNEKPLTETWSYQLPANE